MDYLHKYKDIFGKPKQGAHQYRFLGTAVVDYILTIIGAILIGNWDYFSHSFFSQCNEYVEAQYIILKNKKVIASVAKNNICGLQFHPEISGAQGHKILKNFSKI